MFVFVSILKTELCYFASFERLLFLFQGSEWEGGQKRRVWPTSSKEPEGCYFLLFTSIKAVDACGQSPSVGRGCGSLVILEAGPHQRKS